MKKKIISTDKAPAAIGPYNQGTIYNGVLYTAGQVAIKPGSKDGMVTDTIENETHQVLKNIGAILQAAGTTFENVLKATVFVKDMAQYSRINGVCAQYFDADTAPARELVQVANLPAGVNIEISVIAAVE